MEPNDWDIRRKGREWSDKEFDQRVSAAPEKIEYTGAIFYNERERLVVLAMLLENLGIDKAVQFGNLEDWKAAVAEREKRGANAFEGIGRNPMTQTITATFENGVLKPTLPLDLPERALVRLTIEPVESGKSVEDKLRLGTALCKL